MRFVYTAPRYHTNQHFPVKALLDAGHYVSFLTLTRGQSEEYEALTPTVLGYSPTYDMLLRLVGKCSGKNLVGRPQGSASRVGGIPPVLEFWYELRRRQPSAVIIREPLTSGYGKLSVLAAKLIGARVVFYTQSPKHRYIRKKWKKIVNSFILRVTGAEWITPVLGEKHRYDPLEKCHYVPFVIEPQTSPQEKQWFSGNVVNILTVGKFQRRKNHHLFLEVISRLSGRYSIRATIISENSTPDHQYEFEDLEKYSKHLGMDDKVEFKVNLSFSDVQEQYSKHDMFVLASRNEPAAVSPLEAMAHSLPVVCSDSNGTRCYIRPGENGFIFRTDDPDDLEACLERILENRKGLVEMGNRSYELVVAEHAPKRYVDALFSIVNPRD